MIQLSWRKFFTKTSFWLGTEIFFSLIGIDKIAAYSEFLFGYEWELYKKNHRIIKVSKLSPKFCFKVNEICPVTKAMVRQANLPQDNSLSEDKVFTKKCKQLKDPCIKVWCLSHKKLTHEEMLRS
jgi:hypothetical protein